MDKFNKQGLLQLNKETLDLITANEMQSIYGGARDREQNLIAGFETEIAPCDTGYSPCVVKPTVLCNGD